MDTYKKKYEDSLLRAIVAHKDEDRHLKATLEGIFPELKKYEDEWMCNVAINACKYMMENFENSTKQYEDAIAWLEKQGDKSNIFIWNNASEEPEEMQELLLEWESEDATWHEVGFYHQNDKTYWDGERKIDNVTRWCYIEELLEKQGKQKPDWSEEDEKIITGIINDIQKRLEDYPLEQLAEIYFKEIKWLKSLKQRIGG